MLKAIFKFGAITAVGIGVLGAGALLLAGPNRTRAVLHKFHDDLQERIDECIDDPTALRAQLQELEQEYPERIAQVRGDLAELNEQVRQLERERAISERVVVMADRDLAQLEPQLADVLSRKAGPMNGSANGAVLVAFDENVVTPGRAQAKLTRIRNTRIAYGNRAADAQHDLVYMQQQADRLEELLAQLEDERAQFQSQIWQLSRQVDAIARNDRLIGLLEKRNRTLEECNRYDVASLDQLTGRLAEIRSRQEAELDMLASSQQQTDYEEMARLQVRSEQLEAAHAADEIDAGRVVLSGKLRP
jgi:predicted nuclease with TOPRIM domain